MEIDSAVTLARETAHALEEAVELYDRVEAYEICGQGLREAYVGLKRLRHQVWGPSCVLRPQDVLDDTAGLLHRKMCLRDICLLACVFYRIAVILTRWETGPPNLRLHCTVIRGRVQTANLGKLRLS